MPPSNSRLGRGHHTGRGGKAEEVAVIAGIKPRGMGVRGSGDQQVHRARPWLAAGKGHRSMFRGNRLDVLGSFIIAAD